MADFKNQDFIDSYEELLELAKKLTNKWDPSISSEADPGVVFLKLLAMLNDRQNYKKDIAEAQAYPETVFDRQSAFDLLQMLGYVLKEQKSATGYVEARKEIEAGTILTLPIFTPICNSDKTLYYFTTTNTEFDNYEGQATTQMAVNVPVMEGSPFAIEKEGIDEFTIKDIDESGRFFLQKSGLAVNGVFIGIKEIDNENRISYNYTKWQNIESSVLYPKGSYFFVLSNTDGENYIKFPSNFVELLRDSVFKVQATYSAGGDGNCLKGTLTLLQGSDELDGFNIRQYFDITTGENQETIQLGFQNYYNSMEIFNTIVTSFDLNEAIKVVLNADEITSSSKSQRMFSNSYSRTAIDRQQKVIANYKGSVSYPHYYFNDSEPDRQVDTLCLKSTIEYKDGFEIINQSPYIASTIKAQLDNSKTLAADIKFFENPEYIRADATITGVVYTNIDTKAQANEILEKIKVALKSKYKAENLTFGKAFNQQEVIETIQKADSRILNSAIAPISYQVKKITSSGEEKLSSADQTEIAAKSVIEGIVPLYKFSSRSNTEDITNLNPGYVNSGFGMTSYKRLGGGAEINPEILSTGFNNGYSRFNSANQLLPTQLLQFVRPLYKPEIDYGYGMKYWFYSPTTSDISITSDSTLLKSCSIGTGSKVVLDKDSNTTSGIIGAIGTSTTPNNNKFYRSATTDPWICNSTPSAYLVQEQVVVLSGSVIKTGSLITSSSTVNGAPYTKTSILNGQTHKLVGAESLRIWSNSNPAPIEYTDGTVIQVNGLDLTNNLSTGDILSTTQTISIMSEDSSDVPAESNYFVVLNYKDHIDVDPNGYLLEDGEFFVYANSSLSEYIILGAGTKLTSTETKTLDNNVNADVLNNITSDIFKNLGANLTAISNEVSSFSSESEVSEGYSFVASLTDTDWKQLNTTVKITSVANSENSQTFDSDYAARLVLLLETDKDGQIKFQEFYGDNNNIGLTLKVGEDEVVVSGRESSQEEPSYAILLCSSYLRVVVTTETSYLLTSGLAKFSVANYGNPGQGVDNMKFSPSNFSADFPGNGSVDVPFVAEQNSQYFILQSSVQNGVDGISFSFYDGSTEESIDPLTEKNGYFLYKLSLNSAIQNESANLTLKVTNNNTVAKNITLSRLSCISGYSDEILNTGILAATADDYYSPSLASEVIETEIGVLDSDEYFDWLATPSNSFEHPTSSESFFNSQHPWNYKTLPYIDFDKIDSTLKVMPISGRFKA